MADQHAWHMGSLLLLSIYLSTSLSHYIYIHLSLPNSQNLWTRQALWLAADPSPPSPAHHLADGAVPQWRKMRSCRGLALCALISSPQCPQSVFHQNKAILNFYCINWILKDRSTKNGNSVSIYSPLRCSNQYDFFVLWNTKEAILKNNVVLDPIDLH